MIYNDMRIHIHRFMISIHQILALRGNPFMLEQRPAPKGRQATAAHRHFLRYGAVEMATSQQTEHYAVIPFSDRSIPY